MKWTLCLGSDLFIQATWVFQWINVHALHDPNVDAITQVNLMVTSWLHSQASAQRQDFGSVKPRSMHDSGVGVPSSQAHFTSL
jgi:hypothetical protein